MKERPKAFEVIARQDEDDTFYIRAGVGCLALSVGWLLTAMGAVAWAFAKLVLT